MSKNIHPLVVEMEDSIVHTEENDFECEDADCLCHWEQATRIPDCFLPCCPCGRILYPDEIGLCRVCVDRIEMEVYLEDLP